MKPQPGLSRSLAEPVRVMPDGCIRKRVAGVRCVARPGDTEYEHATLALD